MDRLSRGLYAGKQRNDLDFRMEEHTAESSNQLEIVQSRARKADMSCVPVSSEDGTLQLVELTLQGIPSRRTIRINRYRAHALTQAPFEEYSVLQDLLGYLCGDTGRAVVAMAELSGGHAGTRWLDLEPVESNSEIDSESPSPSKQRTLEWTIRYPWTEIGVSVESRPDPFLDAIDPRPFFIRQSKERRPRLVLSMNGLQGVPAGELGRVIAEIGTAVCLHLSTTARVDLELPESWDRRSLNSPHRDGDRHNPSSPLKGVPEPAPAAFYRYGAAAVRLPLVQYLAMYQVMEHFFPIYSERARCERLKRVLRSPQFDAFSESDLARAVHACMGTGPTRSDPERDQLEAVLESCVGNNELAEAIEGLPELQRKTLSEHTINPKNEKATLANQVATRIYDIRCRIVHTKSIDAPSKPRSPLLPNGQEIKAMSDDLWLIRLLAERTLAANLRPFK